MIMVFRGKPSKACERCRARRLRVSVGYAHGRVEG